MNANDSQPVRWTGGRIAALVAGIAIAFIGLALLVAGIGLLIVHGTHVTTTATTRQAPSAWPPARTR